MDYKISYHLLKNKTFIKWLNRVSDDKTPWTENEIIYFRKYLRHNNELARILLSKFKGNYLITQEQTLKGIEYLKNTCFKKNGQVRQTKDMPFGAREMEIIKNFKEFKFNDVLNVGNYCDFYLPIYEVIAHDGNSFIYSTNMGQMEVLG